MSVKDEKIPGMEFRGFLHEMFLQRFGVAASLIATPGSMLSKLTCYSRLEHVFQGWKTGDIAVWDRIYGPRKIAQLKKWEDERERLLEGLTRR